MIAEKHAPDRLLIRIQHRFIETALGSAGLGKANAIAEKMGFGAIGDQVGSFAKNFIGDYLHTF